MASNASGDSPEPMDELSPGSSSNDVYTDVISSCVINAGPEAVTGLAAGTTTLSAAAGVELLPGHSRNSSSTSHSGSGSASGYGSLNSQSLHSRQSSTGELGHFRNPSNGSGFSDTGSMERAKVSASGAAAAAVAAAAAAEKRKKFEESKESRIDAKQVIDELIKSANLEHDESEQASGLKLTDITKHAQAQWEGSGPKSVFGSVW